MPRTMSMAITFPTASRLTCGMTLLFLFLLPFALCTSTKAHHFCLDDTKTSGLIAVKLHALRGQNAPIGCLLSEERDVPDNDGRYNDFENGQIVWSPSQKMVIAAFRTPDDLKLWVDWEITDQYQYDFFLVRAYPDPYAPDDKQHSQQQTVSGQRTKGSYTFLNLPSGRNTILIEGCDNGPAGSSTCRQGWTNPAYVDVGFIDVAHKLDQTGHLAPFPAADTPTDTANQFEERLRVAFLKACSATFPLDNSIFPNVPALTEAYAATALSKLFMSDTTGVPGCDAATLINTVNNWLSIAVVSGDVGTDVNPPGPPGSPGLPCGRKGDYDMALGVVMPIMYRYGSKLRTDVHKHILHDLLTQSGGADQVRTSWTACDVQNIPETENHVLMTETARYLTNQLLLGEVLGQHTSDPQNPAVGQARIKYDNRMNGLAKWMLGQLQGFLRGDFHEYNARPYERFSIVALHNLAEYAGDAEVAKAAQIVLDYLAAKFAISSSGLRRAAPFRRHYDHLDYSPLYGNYSDELTWRFVTMAGNTDLLQKLRYGRADWGSPGDMGYPALGQYRVHDLILDFILSNDSIPLMRYNRNVPYFQVLRHEGVELYARSRNFLISAGGNWEDNTSRDQFFIFTGGEDTNGAALPTTLMPTFSGVDRKEFISIQGNPDAKKRYNTCVALNFACGLFPVIPDSFLRRFRTVSRPCAHVVNGIIQNKWIQMGAADGPLGCPISDQMNATQSTGVFQLFERGQIVWSEPQRLIMAAYYERGNNTIPNVSYNMNIHVNWTVTDTFNYDFFIVRWGVSGVDVYQQDVQSGDPNATRTSGNWTIPLESGGQTSGLGQYAILIEGCDHHVTGSICHQGWATPILTDFPFPNSCIARVADGDHAWNFVDASDKCGAPVRAGYYAAVYNAPCGDSSLSSPCAFGFFEAVDQEDMSFSDFQSLTLNNNRSRQFTPSGTNVYTTHDGRQITFTPDHQSHQWGITAITPADQRKIPADMEQWRLAKGDVIDADGTGCVIFKNAKLNRALVLDIRTAATPREFQAILQPNLTCDAASIGP
jgi:hypothetical protein